MIVQKPRADNATAGDGVVEHREETIPGLSETGFDVGNDTAVVVKQTEDNCALRATGCRIGQNRAVQGVSLPEFSAHRSFPAIAGTFELHSRAGEPLSLEDPLYGGDRYLGSANTAGEFEFTKNERS